MFLLSLHIAFRIASHPFIFFFDGVQEIDAINISSGRGNKPNPRCVFRTPRNAVDINKKEKISVALLGRPKIKDKSCDMVILCRRCHLLAGRLRWERSYSASRPFFPVPWLDEKSAYKFVDKLSGLNAEKFTFVIHQEFVQSTSSGHHRKHWHLPVSENLEQSRAISLDQPFELLLELSRLGNLVSSNTH